MEDSILFLQMDRFTEQYLNILYKEDIDKVRHFSKFITSLNLINKSHTL